MHSTALLVRWPSRSAPFPKHEIQMLGFPKYHHPKKQEQRCLGWFLSGFAHTLGRMNRTACPFCNLPQERVLLETGTTLAFFAGFLNRPT
jgi:hypothetical protein